MRNVADGRKLNICFVGLDNFAFLRPDLEIPHMGGEAVQQSILARSFALRGHRVSTIVLDYGQPNDSVIDNIRIISAYEQDAGIKGLRFFHPRMSGLWRALRRANADIYYQSPAGVLTGATAAFCRIYSRKMLFRVASDANCIPGQQLIGYWRDRKIYEYGLRRSDIRAVQTRNQRAMLSKNYELDSVVVNMVVERESDEDSESKSIDVLWVNNLRNVKRPEKVISIARALPQYKFVMIGGACRGAERLFEEIENEASRMPNMTFLGSKSYRYVNNCLRRSKLLLNTSELEGFPNTYLQAWVRGVPVVTTFDPDGLVGSRKLGAATSKIDELPGLLEQYLANERHLSECSERVRKFAVQDFSPDSVVSRYLSLIT